MLFGSTRAFQNGMTWSGSTKNHGAAPPQAKGLGASQVLPDGDWAGEQPTQKLLNANLATPESFTLIGPPIQKHLMTNTPLPLCSKWWLKSKTEKHRSLKIQFQVGSVLYKIGKIFKKITPSNLPFQHPQLPTWAQIKKITWTLLFASPNPFQNGMTQ